jgi:two-component system, sensor histidine kinase PdtaS
LAFYDKKIKTELKKGNYDEVSDLIKFLSDKGEKTLNPLIFSYFYELGKNDALAQQHNIKGLIYNYVGSMEFFRSDMQAAKSAFKLALVNFQLADKKANAAGMAMNLGVLQERAMQYDSAILSYEHAIPIFQTLSDTVGVAMCLENIALAYNYKGEYSKSLVFFNKTDSVLKINTPVNHGRWTNLYYNRANVLSNLGRLDSALYYLYKGLKISEELDDDRRKAMAYIELAGLHKKLDDKKKWLRYTKLGLEFSEKTNNGLRITELNNRLGYHYLEQGNLDSAAYFANKSLDYFRDNNFSEGLAKGYLLRGTVSYEKKEYSKALKEYQLAMENIGSTESTELASIYHGLGHTYLKLNFFDYANEYLTKALDLRLGWGELENIRLSYEALSELNKTKGDYKKAYEYYVLFKTYGDSVFNETTIRQIAEIQTVYETEKKDQAIAGLEQETQIQRLLGERQRSQIYLSSGGFALFLIIAFVFFNRSRLKHKANRMLETKNQLIEKQHQEKEMLLREIHHRVKNNLQIISSLLSMQTRGMHDTKMIDAMKESQSRVKTMALIHEKLYQYDNLARINMKEYMNELSDFLAQTYRSDKEIKVIIEANDVLLDLDTAVPLGLITNELLTNAHKYAFQDMDQGEIKIMLRNIEDDGYKLVISDTGKGMDKDIDISHSSSLGLKLVRTLTKQINGDLSISVNPGATFSIYFRENFLAV